jgi:peptide chain release factor 2
MRERGRLEQSVSAFKKYSTDLQDNLELAELAELEQDIQTEEAIIKSFENLADILAEVEMQTLLSGEIDCNDSYLEIHAGSGGTESQDWAQILLRMYMRWGERNGYKVELIEETVGDVAGVKSVTLLFKGEYAYGKLKTESGVHRLVRISPFDSNARRHTSFSSVWVYPVIDDNIDIEINPADLRIDVYRSSGAGGQHVNTTDSAVRITHQPSGIVVQCQNDRSQHKNKATAMSMLKSRLYEAELKKREEAADAVNSTKTDIGWGHQIRSYVLQPYRMVKDLRTGVTSSSTDAVLDGDLNQFIAASLAQRIEGISNINNIEDIE